MTAFKFLGLTEDDYRAPRFWQMPGDTGSQLLLRHTGCPMSWNCANVLSDLIESMPMHAITALERVYETNRKNG